MVGTTAKHFPDFRLKKNKCYVELIFRPSVPDNISNMQAFKGDEWILELLHCERTFKIALVDQKEHDRPVNESEDEVIYFMDKFIVSRFGIPDILMFDNASYFSSLKLTKFAIDRSICIRHASRYYPQVNGVGESSNKKLIHVIHASLADN